MAKNINEFNLLDYRKGGVTGSNCFPQKIVFADLLYRLSGIQ